MVHVEQDLPVGKYQLYRARRDDKLARHEEVLSDRVGSEMGEVAEAKGTERIAGGQVEDLLADVPGVAVPADRGVLLRHRRVGGDVAVEKVVREPAQQIGDKGGQLVQIGEHRLTEEDVRPER